MYFKRDVTFFILFAAMIVTAAGYGCSFLLTEHYRSLGGNEIDTGWTLGGAVVGTLVGVPGVGWLAPRLGATGLACAASVAVALGFGGLSVLTHLSPLIAVPGFLIGLGWGAFYLAAPMALSERVSDRERPFWFMWLNAFQMAGIGGGPLVANLVHARLAVPTVTIFRAVFVGCLIAAVFGAIFRRLSPAHTEASRGGTDWLRAIVPLSRTAAIYPICMVLLGACVFTSILTFQSSIARTSHFDTALFYGTYTASVVLARVTLAAGVARSNPNLTAPLLLACMALGVVTALAQGTNVALYVASAALLGIGYGLVYSVIQSQVVNDVPTQYRAAALTWFVLAYFIGVFGFPLIGGVLIVDFGASSLLYALLVIALAELALALVWGRRRTRERRGAALGGLAAAVPAARAD